MTRAPADVAPRAIFPPISADRLLSRFSKSARPDTVTAVLAIIQARLCKDFDLAIRLAYVCDAINIVVNAAMLNAISRQQSGGQRVVAQHDPRVGFRQRRAGDQRLAPAYRLHGAPHIAEIRPADGGGAVNRRGRVAPKAGAVAQAACPHFATFASKHSRRAIFGVRIWPRSASQSSRVANWAIGTVATGCVEMKSPLKLISSQTVKVVMVTRPGSACKVGATTARQAAIRLPSRRRQLPRDSRTNCRSAAASRRGWPRAAGIRRPGWCPGCCSLRCR